MASAGCNTAVVLSEPANTPEALRFIDFILRQDALWM